MQEKPKPASQIPVTSSAEIMRKSLDKLGGQFQPSQQIQQKGIARYSPSMQRQQEQL